MTRTPLSRSKGQRSTCRGRGYIVAASRTACYAPAPVVGALSYDARLTSVCLVTYIGPKSRTERSRKTKIGTEVAHVTCDSDTTFKVKRSTCRGLPHSLLPMYSYCTCHFILLSARNVLAACTFARIQLETIQVHITKPTYFVFHICCRCIGVAKIGKIKNRWWPKWPSEVNPPIKHFWFYLYRFIMSPPLNGGDIKR